MGLIDIDDRDVFNYFMTPSIKSNELLKQWLMELKANNPTSKVITLGNGIYQLNLTTITCTGSDVDTRFNIPHMHQLLRIETKHTDSSDVDSTDSLAYSISKRHYPNLWMLLLNIPKTTASGIIDEYIGYYMDLGEYLIVSNSTNTDRLHISITVKITGA